MTGSNATSVGAAALSSLDALERLVAEIGDLQSKLLLLAGNGGKTRMLRALAQRLNTAPFNVGANLAHRLAATPSSERGFSTYELLREITDSASADAPLLLDNLEVLFEPSLKISPLDLIKRLAHSRRVVAVWPGEMRGDRLAYASIEHPDHRNYNRDGVVVFETAQSQLAT